MIFANSKVRSSYMGTKRSLDHVFLELNNQNTPDLDKLKAHLITEYGIDVDDPLDSSYEILDTLHHPISGVQKHHIYVRITPDMVQFSTAIEPWVEKKS